MPAEGDGRGGRGARVDHGDVRRECGVGDGGDGGERREPHAERGEREALAGFAVVHHLRELGVGGGVVLHPGLHVVKGVVAVVGGGKRVGLELRPNGGGYVAFKQNRLRRQGEEKIFLRGGNLYFEAIPVPVL